MVNATLLPSSCSLRLTGNTCSVAFHLALFQRKREFENGDAQVYTSAISA